MICHGCGGVVGRDCFNPQECEWITRQMADESQVIGQENQRLQNDLYHANSHIELLQKEVERLRSIIRGTSDWAKCGFVHNHPNDEYPEIIEQALDI